MAVHPATLGRMCFENVASATTAESCRRFCAMTRTEYHRVQAPSLSTGNEAAGEIVVHGHWGRPVIWFPSEAGSNEQFADFGILDAIRPADRRRPAHRVLRAVVRPVVLVGHRRARWATGPGSTVGTRTWIVDQVVPVRPGPLRRPGRHRPGRAVDGGVPRGADRPALPAPVRRGRSASPATTTPGAGGPGATADDDTYFSNPMDFVPGTSRWSPGLPARAARPHPGGGQRLVGGHHRRERHHPPPGRRAGRQADPARAVRLGSRNGRTTGRAGARRPRCTCRRSVHDVLPLPTRLPTCR